MIELYCDGSCPRPQGPGGWAYVIVMQTREIEGSGAERATTNNRMEMMAAIKGFHYLRDNGNAGQLVRLISDSQYVIKGISQYVHTWKRMAWQRKDGDRRLVPVKNTDLWKELYMLAYSDFKTEYEWVRGHNGHRFNERCDKLAGEQAWNLIEST